MALLPLVGTPWWVWAETVENFIKTMNTKNSTSSATRQHKRLCPASEDFDTDGDSNCNFARWLVIESNDSDQPLTRLTIRSGKGVECSDRYTEVYKTSPKGDVLVETDSSTYSRMLLWLTQLAGEPVKVSPHRSLNTSRGVICSRDSSLQRRGDSGGAPAPGSHRRCDHTCKGWR